jgi:hypothetical protein
MVTSLMKSVLLKELNKLNHNAHHDLILTMDLWRDSMYPSLISPQVLLS